MRHGGRNKRSSKFKKPRRKPTGIGGSSMKITQQMKYNFLTGAGKKGHTCCLDLRRGREYKGSLEVDE